MDRKILSTKLTNQTQDLIANRMSTVQATTEFLIFVKASQELASEYLADSTLFPLEEGIRLIRLAVRASHAVGITQWILEVKSNDPVVQSFQLNLSPITDLDSLLKKQSDLLQNLDPLKDPEGYEAQISILYNLMEILGSQGRLDKMREYLSQARNSYLKELPNQLLSYIFARVIGLIAWWEREKGDVDQAKKLNTEALELANDINSESLLGFTYTLIGALYSQEGDVKKALEHYKKAKEVRESIGDELRATGNESSMAWDVMALGRPHEAMELLKNAYTKYKRLLPPGRLPSGVVLYLADVCRIGGLLDDALKYAKEAYNYSTQADTETYAAGGARVTLASILIDRGELNEAQQILEELAKTIKAVPMDYIIFGYYYELGRLELQRRNFGQADEALQEALRWASKPGNFDPLLKTQLSLTQLYIQEYRMTDNLLFLNKARVFIENVVQATYEQEFIYLLYQALILRSNIEALQGQNDDALKTLN
ncbi:MAG: tetratricopeptide repeat protein, partial [Candidatus Hodarchaeota archaeon]